MFLGTDGILPRMDHGSNRILSLAVSFTRKYFIFLITFDTSKNVFSTLHVQYKFMSVDVKFCRFSPVVWVLTSHPNPNRIRLEIIGELGRTAHNRYMRMPLYKEFTKIASAVVRRDRLKTKYTGAC